jgi:hypothetical protein
MNGVILQRSALDGAIVRDAFISMMMEVQSSTMVNPQLYEKAVDNNHFFHRGMEQGK